MEEHVAQAARFSHYTYAIVVGIIDYHAKGLEDLPACTADAEALESALTDSAGCAIPLENVLRLPDQNATAAAILDALAWLVQGRTAYDTLVIYFAGHGAVRDGQFFFLTGSNDKQPGVAASALDELLSTTQLRGVLLIVRLLWRCGSRGARSKFLQDFSWKRLSPFSERFTRRSIILGVLRVSKVAIYLAAAYCTAWRSCAR